MSENEKQYLVKARACLLNDDKAGAVGAYTVVATENPANGEAAFFCTYADYIGAQSDYAKGKGSSARIKDAFEKIVSSLEAAVESVAKSEGTKEEKLAVIAKIAEIYTPMPNHIITMRMIPSSKIEQQVVRLHLFSSYIQAAFNSDNDAMKIAIIPLKEAVSLQQKFYGYKYEGFEVADTAARIQKIDPSYVVPKKAGCVSIG